MASNEIFLRSINQWVVLKGVLHADELLAEHLKREPKPRGTVPHRVWRKDYNTIVDAVNKITGSKRYNLKK